MTAQNLGSSREGGSVEAWSSRGAKERKSRAVVNTANRRIIVIKEIRTYISLKKNNIECKINDK